MSLKFKSSKKYKITKRYKGSNNHFSVHSIDSSSATNEDSLGSSSSAGNATTRVSDGVYSPIGHGPSKPCILSAEKPKLSGNKADFPFWQIRAEAYFDKLDLGSVLKSSNPDPVKNKELYLELVNLVDNESLQVISSTAQNDGKLAYEKLRNYYLGDDNAQMVTAMHQVHLLKLNPGESIQQFICRCDTLRATLNSFPKTQGCVEIYLVIAALGALPDSFSVFKTVINTAPVLADWDNFKAQLLNHVNIETTNQQLKNNTVMNIQHKSENTMIIKPKQNHHFKKFLNRPRPIRCNNCNAKNDHLTKNCGKIMKGHNQNFQGQPPSWHQQYSPFPKGRGNGAHFQSGPRPQNSWNHPWNKQKHNKHGPASKGKFNQRA